MHKLLLSLICLVATAGVYAAPDAFGVSVSASVNKTALALDDELVLTVTVDGAAADFTPQLPSMPAFNVYARSTAKQIQNYHATTTFEYIMMPRFPGKTTIGPISVRYGNKTYQTDPIDITIYRTPPPNTNTTATQAASTNNGTTFTQPQTATLQPAPAEMPPLERELYNRAARHAGQDYFMVAAASSTTPLVNQMITVVERFYYARPFSDSAPYTAPSISNLFLEEINRSEGRQTIGGRTYSYIEIRYGATAVTTGKAEIGPAQITYIPIHTRAASFFDRMFAAVSAEPQQIQSNAITLMARAVPAQNQPSSFYGAVGSGYTISASLDRNEIEAGDAVNLLIKINGPGNLKSTSDLKMPEMLGFKTYDVASSAAAVVDNGTLKSYKLFKTVLVPNSSGVYTIPAFEWSYYDPDTRQYRTIRTQPISLTVTPSSQEDTGFDFSGHSDLGSGFQSLGTDIHYLKSSVYQKEFNFFNTLAQWSWINYIGLLLLMAGCVFALTDKTSLADKRTFSKIKNQLKVARTPEQVAEAISVYLQMKYTIHTASLPLRSIENALAEHHCSQEAIEQFKLLWQQLDAARFAPVALQGKTAQELAQQALSLIQLMEKGGSL